MSKAGIRLQPRLPDAVQQEQSLIAKTSKAGGPGQSGDLDHCAHRGPDLSGPLFFNPVLVSESESE
jgi:hypothetical protein